MSVVRITDAAAWFRRQDCSITGLNEYLILRRNGVGSYAQPAIITADGGTGNHSRALREYVELHGIVGEAHWAVIGPAHGGERRLILLQTEGTMVVETRTEAAVA